MKHKTDSIGPVNISITKSLYNEMLLYVKHARSSLNGIDKRDFDFAFVHYAENQMSSNLITKQFNSFWKKVCMHVSMCVCGVETTTMISNHLRCGSITGYLHTVNLMKQLTRSLKAD